MKNATPSVKSPPRVSEPAPFFSVKRWVGEGVANPPLSKSMPVVCRNSLRSRVGLGAVAKDVAPSPSQSAVVTISSRGGGGGRLIVDIFALAILKVGSLGAGFFGFGFIVLMLIVGSVSDSAVASEITLGGAILIDSAVSVSNVSCADLADSLGVSFGVSKSGSDKAAVSPPQAVRVSIISRANASGVLGFIVGFYLWILFGVILFLLFSGLSRVALWFIFGQHLVKRIY